MSEDLGRAILDLGADVAPLDRDLKDAEKRVAISVAAMQAMLDGLHADVDVHVSALSAAAARIESAAAASNAGSAAAAGTSASHGVLWGVRGPEKAGSIVNPIVTVQEAAKYTPMGSYAAAVGESNMSDAQTGDNQSGLATSADMAALTAAVHELAQNQAPGAQVAAAGQSGIGEPGAGARTVVSLDRTDSDALGRAAVAMENLAHTTVTGHKRPVATAASRAGQQRELSAADAAIAALQRLRAERGVDFQTAGSIQRVLNALGASEPPSRGGTDRVVVLSRGGQSSTGGSFTYMLPGGGGGGGRVPPVLIPPAGGGSGGGGFATLAGMGLLSRLGWGHGNGLFGFGTGMAGMGSALDFAGFGFEHLLATGLGVLGSAASAGLGGGLKLLGTAGPFAVGGGSDLAVMKSTIADTQTLAKAMSNLTTAQQTYGKSSQQAKQAAQQLQQTIQQLGNTAGVHAEMRLARAGQALDHMFDLHTSNARVQAAGIGIGAIGVGRTFVPMIGQAADQNLTVIRQQLQPLFQWLKGPDGIGIFNNLEDVFLHNLPASMGAFDNGVELLLRVVNIASKDTGGFTQWLDKLFTRLNSMSNPQLAVWVQKYVNDFELWARFVKLLIVDLHGLFAQDVGTGNSIISTLNGMLERLRAYEKSARGQSEIQNIFIVHKNETLALLHLFGDLAATFAHIEMDVAPSMVGVMNNAVLPVLKLVGGMLADIAKLSPVAGDALGAALMLWRFGGVGAVLKTWGAISGAIAGEGAAADVSAGETAALDSAVAGTGGANMLRLGGAASSATATASEAEAASPGLLAAGGLLRGGLLPGALRGGAGFLGGSMLANAFGMASIGTRGSTGQVLSGIGHGALEGLGAGAGIGSVFGPLGLAIGAGAGGLLGAAGAGLDALLNGTKQVSVNMHNAQQAAAHFHMNPGDTLNLREIGNFSNWSYKQLQALMGLLRPGITVRVNGRALSEAAVHGIVKTALAAKTKIHDANEQINQSFQRWFTDTGRGLGALEDDFKTRMRLIASVIGTNSRQGERDGAKNIGMFVTAVSNTMARSLISVKDGMRAIDQATGQGIKAGTLTWQHGLQLQIGALDSAYQHQKIAPTEYYAGVQRIVEAGEQHVRDTQHQSLVQQLQDLKSQEQQGLLTQQQYAEKRRAAISQSNSRTKLLMTDWVTIVAHAMSRAAADAASGAGQIAKDLESALGQANSVTSAEARAIAGAGAVRDAAGNQPAHGQAIPTRTTTIQVRPGEFRSVPAHATGGLVVNEPTILTGEQAPQHPEVVIATNPAYRERNLGLWAQAGQMLGVPGMAHGGIHGGLPITPGRLAGAPKGGSPMSRFARMVSALAAIMGPSGDYQKTSELLSYWPQLWALTDTNLGSQSSSFIVSQDALGNPIAPYIDYLSASGVNASLADLGGEQGWYQEQISDIDKALPMSGKLRSEATLGIAARKAHISGIRQRIARNVTHIRALNAQIKEWNRKTAAAQKARVNALYAKINAANANAPSGSSKQINAWYAQINKEQARRKPDRKKINAWYADIHKAQAQAAAARTASRKQINAWYAQIAADRAHPVHPYAKEIAAATAKVHALQSQDRGLGGNPNSAGTGGEIGGLDRQLSTLQNDLSLVTGSGAYSPLTLIGASGLGGDIGAAKIGLATVQSQLGQLTPAALQAALAAASAGFAGSGAGTASGAGAAGAAGTASSTQTQLLEQQNAQLAEMLAVSQAQYQVLAQLPAYGGSFATGGVVPGPVGAARMIEAHGGETVIPVGGSQEVHVHIDGKNAGWLTNLIDVRIERSGRNTSRTVSRNSPSHGGGTFAGRI